MREKVARFKVHREPGQVRAGGGGRVNMAPELRA